MDIASWVQGCGVPPLSIPPLLPPERSSVAAVVRARQASAYVARATCLGGDVVEMRLVESSGACVRGGETSPRMVQHRPLDLGRVRAASRGWRRVPFDER